ncbi:nucleoside hydrolase [Sphingomonas oleivorans]|uniref:Nucleoside hydrolase n=2 Tax=Sphingomonas oleivorans TaxID=1735121 RepID=A0A2T5G327_9SPHN|nr:nucleoside hydrolase [Sphingomonas oleivorans]
MRAWRNALRTSGRALLGGLFFGLFLIGGPAEAAEPKRKVILDDDIGGLMGSPVPLLQAPDVELLGITITSGSTWRDVSVAHALRVVEIAGRTDIPVVPGAIFPLVNSEELTRRWEGVYGKLVYKGAWMNEEWPEGTIQSQPQYHAYNVVPSLKEGNPTTKPSPEIAANFLIRKVREFPGQITIIATGPMTNIALAQSLDPTFAENVKELVYMGGSLNPHQKLPSLSAEQFAREYVNSPRREFNIRWDPEAAKIMAHAPWRKVTMVPVDPSTGTELTRAFLDSLGKVDTPLAKMIVKTAEAGFPMWDEIAAAVWLDPSIISKSVDLYVDFETSFTSSYGDTLSWTADYRPGLGERPQNVVQEVDRAKLEALLHKLYAAPLRH